jgi:hypothetical protein
MLNYLRHAELDSASLTSLSWAEILNQVQDDRPLQDDALVQDDALLRMTRAN